MKELVSRNFLKIFLLEISMIVLLSSCLQVTYPTSVETSKHMLEQSSDSLSQITTQSSENISINSKAPVSSIESNSISAAITPDTELSRPLFIDSINGYAITGGTLEAGKIFYSMEPDQAPNLKWQWYVCDELEGQYAEIPGANASKYTASPSDYNKYVNVSVTASGSAVGTAISDPVLIGKLVLKPLKPLLGFYPVITSNSNSTGLFSGGKGTKAEPFIIKTAEQFMLLESNTTDTYFRLGNDIDLTGKGTIKGKFYGELDGAGYLVKFRSTTGDGLFQEIAAGAALRNLRITGKNIPVISIRLKSCSVGNLVNYNYGTINRCSVENFNSAIYEGVNVRAGGLAGANFGMITECYTSGSFLLHLERRDPINGFYPSLADEYLSDWNRGWCGGVVGSNKSGAVVRNCYSSMNITVDSPGDLTYGISGGLIAFNSGDVKYCYSVGKVSKNGYCGGLVGSNDSKGNIESSYYDKQTSGRSDNNGKGIPKTTSEMKNAATFIGWRSDIWKFSDNQSSYPIFK